MCGAYLLSAYYSPIFYCVPFYHRVVVFHSVSFMDLIRNGSDCRKHLPQDAEAKFAQIESVCLKVVMNLLETKIS